MKTSLNKIKQLELFEQDQFQIVYFAFDTEKKKECYLIFPNHTTSWEYDLIYI